LLFGVIAIRDAEIAIEREPLGHRDTAKQVLHAPESRVNDSNHRICAMQKRQLYFGKKCLLLVY